MDIQGEKALSGQWNVRSRYFDSEAGITRSLAKQAIGSRSYHNSSSIRLFFISVSLSGCFAPSVLVAASIESSRDSIRG